MGAHPSKLKPADKVWIDGELVPFRDAQVHVLTHTLHYGLGAFEGIRGYKRADGGGGVWSRATSAPSRCRLRASRWWRRASRPCAPTRWSRRISGRSSSSATGS